jgi:hypothetical protein
VLRHPGFQVCGAANVCVDAALLPRIETVSGDTPTGITAGIVVEGHNLAGVATLSGNGSAAVELTACAGSSDTLLRLGLPDDLGSEARPLGAYQLTITNAAGDCVQPLQLLRGSEDDGADIVAKLDAARADPAAPKIPVGTFAGLRVTTVAAQAHGGVTRSIRVQGVEQVSSIDNGLFISVIDRVTHAVRVGNVGIYPQRANYHAGITFDIGGLRTLLDNLDDDVIVILASRGDLTASPGGPSMPADNALATAIERIGGSAAFRSLTASDSYVVIGIPGIGIGRGLEMISASSGITAVSTVLIDAAALGLEGKLAP